MFGRKRVFVLDIMYATIFGLALVAAYAAAEIPSYIHVCTRREPDISQCILDNINNLKSKICKGIPELDIPSNDPFVIDKLVITDAPNIKLYIRDAKVTGLCDFKINKFRADINKLHYNFEIVFDQIRGNTTYDFNIRVLIPITHKGNLYITADNVAAKIDFNMELITKGGKRYTYLSKMKINLDIKEYNAQYDRVGEEFAQLNEIIRNFIGENKQEIIKSLKPALEEAVSKRILSVSNDLVKHFTYEELFPE